jgi:hypothetical protein
MTAPQSEPKKTVSASVSNVGQSLSKDQSSRARKYFISMMIRTLCFILAVILPSPYRWFAIFGAVTLPYVAVIVANAGRESIKGRAAVFADGRKQIGAE